MRQHTLIIDVPDEASDADVERVVERVFEHLMVPVPSAMSGFTRREKVTLAEHHLERLIEP